MTVPGSAASPCDKLAVGTDIHMALRYYLMSYDCYENENLCHIILVRTFCKILYLKLVLGVVLFGS